MPALALSWRMPSSRPRKATALKVVAGTDRADRRNGLEPEPMLLNDLSPPARLCDRAKAVWAEVAPALRRVQVLSELDVCHGPALW